MRIHWYWPFPHETSQPLVAAATREGDKITVQALSSAYGKVLPTIHDYSVIRNLPESNNGAYRSSVIARAPSRAWIYFERARARDNLVRRGAFDVSFQFHLNHYVDAIALRRLGKCTPLVSMVHDVRPHEPRFPGRLETRLLRETYRSAGHLVVYHETLRADLAKNFEVDASLIHVIRHPLAIRSIGAPMRSAIGPCRYLFFGTLRKNKGISTLVSALHRLGRTDDFTVHIAGRGHGDNATQVQDLAASFDHITCEIGRVSNVRREQLLSSCDVLLLPYASFSSQSGVLADAYAHGKPMIATDVGALGPSVRTDETGVVIAPSDVESLASAISQLAHDDAARARFARNARRVARLHTYEAVGNELRAVFERASNS